jgi:hypothetical protein
MFAPVPARPEGTVTVCPGYRIALRAPSLFAPTPAALRAPSLFAPTPAALRAPSLFAPIPACLEGTVGVCPVTGTGSP